MKILVIGGSSFVGRHITSRAVAQGHSVTLFNRGKTNAGAIPGVEHLQGDRNGDLGVLAERDWDATIDVCAYVPKQVRTLLNALGTSAGIYGFISTISVYPETIGPGFDETAPLEAPSYSDELTMEAYGALKVGCELTARELAGDRLLIVRPGYVIGPYDPTGRFTYWVERVASSATGAAGGGGGPMLGPDADQPIQAIDGRDLAAFVVGLIEAGVSDTFHATAPDPALSFAEMLTEIADGIEVPRPDVHFGGPRRELPLSDDKSSWGLLQADVTKARENGLTWRPLGETARDLLAWVTDARRGATYKAPAGVGLSAEAEAQLLGS